MNKQPEEIANYEAAIKEFEKIPTWKDAGEKLRICQQRIEAMKAAEEERIAKLNKKMLAIQVSVIGAVIAFLVVVYGVIVPDSAYSDALALMDAGKYNEAITAFEAIKGHKDSTEQAAFIYGKYMRKNLKAAKVGDCVFFGAYEQDNNISNGKEYVQWRVLKVKDGKALVISEYALDCKPYHKNSAYVTWETCTLRKWLNNDFFKAAFSAEEKAMVSTATVSADPGEGQAVPGNETQDQVFLLSLEETNKYFSTKRARQCKPTDYAVAGGAYANDGCWWWLRTPGLAQNTAASIDTFGVKDSNKNNDVTTGAVRPALWIDLKLVEIK